MFLDILTCIYYGALWSARRPAGRKLECLDCQTSPPNKGECQRMSLDRFQIQRNQRKIPKKKFPTRPIFGEKYCKVAEKRWKGKRITQENGNPLSQMRWAHAWIHTHPMVCKTHQFRVFFLAWGRYFWPLPRKSTPSFFMVIRLFSR